MALFQQLLRTDKKCIWKFIWNFGVKGFIGFLRFRFRKKLGDAFPAFQFISLTDDCNLECQGCWVSKAGAAKDMPVGDVCKIIDAGVEKGSHFFGLLGGEPLMYKPIWNVLERYPNCYFQLFTNGTLITEEKVKQLKKLGNVTPLISFEGDEEIADIRRKGKKIYSKALQAVETCSKNGLITGVAVSVCKSNIEMALSDDFVQMLIDRGVIYLWYYIYRPTGADPQYDLALDKDEIERLRRFMVEGRKRFSIVIVDSYWDGSGEPFCPAAEGLSHHINPYGDIEPCPVVQFATDNINNGKLTNIYEDSKFLREFRLAINEKTKGCILMEDPEWLIEFAEKQNAKNTSNREDLILQLKQQPIVCSHGSCEKIREKNILYRIAKKGAFGGLGAYG